MDRKKIRKARRSSTRGRCALRELRAGSATISSPYGLANLIAPSSTSNYAQPSQQWDKELISSNNSRPWPVGRLAGSGNHLRKYIWRRCSQQPGLQRTTLAERRLGARLCWWHRREGRDDSSRPQGIVRRLVAEDEYALSLALLLSHPSGVLLGIVSYHIMSLKKMIWDMRIVSATFANLYFPM